MASAVADCDQSRPNNNYVTPHSVIFQDFSERVPVHDRTISFTYQTLSQSVPQYGDWIGLFRGGGTNPEPSHYVSYIGAKEGSISLNNNSYKASLLLSNSEELDVNTSYQLIYVTTGCNILGCSQSFWFRDGLNIVEDTSSSAGSTLMCKCCQHNNKRQDTCSNDSLDNSCNISQNSSSESLQALPIDSRDFTAHGRLAFQNFSEWLAFMSNDSRQKMKMHKASVKSMDELWHTDPKVMAKRSKNYERSDYTKTSNNASKMKFSMGDKNSLSVAESKKLSDVQADKENDVARTLLFGAEDCMDIINSTPKSKLRRLVSDDYKKKPLMMIEETCSKDQNVRKSNSAELVLSEKIKPQSSSSSVDIFTEAVHTDDAFNTLYLKLAESEGKLKSLLEELKMSTLTVESQESEIKQYRTIMNLQAGELKKHFGTIQSQSMMVLQYQEKMEIQLNELKNLREKTESSIYELKEEKKKNKLLTKELEEVNGRIKLQSSELDMRCTELHSCNALADTLSKELNEVKEQEVARSSEMLLLKEQLEAESSNLKLLKDKDVLDSAELQHLRTEVELKSAELALIKDKDESQSAELKLLQDQLHTKSVEVSSLKETVQSQSLELMQLTATMTSLTVQAGTDRTALAERLKELKAKEKEIEQRKQTEEEQCLKIGQHQTNRESLLAEIQLRDAKEKKMQDELKEISDAFRLCRAQESQLQKDLDKCKTEEEMMLTELTKLRAEKELVADEIDQLKAAKELLVSELDQSKCSYELLLEQVKMRKMNQEKTSFAYFHARNNAELLSRALEKLRSKEECSADELKNSNDRLESISHELMLAREREENSLEELAQLRASGSPLTSELQECHTGDEELRKILEQRKVINSTLSSGLNQSLVNAILVSKEITQTTDRNELEESKANAAELCSPLQQSKHQVDSLADEFQKYLASLRLISEELTMKQEDRKSLAAELESSKLMELQKPEIKRSELAADKENSLTSLPLVSNELEQMQMSKDALIIELEKSKANETRLHSYLLESKIKQDTFMAGFMKTRAKIMEEKKQLVTSSEVVIAEEHASLNLKQLIENEERLSAELRQCRAIEKLLLSELKQYKANEELMSTDLKKYKTIEELLSTELKECKANETRLTAAAIELKAYLEKSKINEEVLSSDLTEFKVKEEMCTADLKESKINEEILMVELKQAKASEERLSSELNKSRGRLENLSVDLTRIRADEEMLVADLKDCKEREAVLSAELYQFQIDQESLPTEFKQYDISGGSLSNKLEDYKIKEEMLATKLKECKAKEEIVSTELKKGTASEEILSQGLKEYDVKEGILCAGLKLCRTREDLHANDLKKCRAKESMSSAELPKNEISKHAISVELKKFKSSEEGLSLKQRKICQLLLSGEMKQLQSQTADDPSGVLPEKAKSGTSQGVVEEVTADRCQQKKRSCQAFEKMSQSTIGEEVSASPKPQAHSKSSQLAIIEQLQKRITAQSEEIFQYREKMELLLYKNLLSVNQTWSVCEDLTQTGIKEEPLKSMVVQSEMTKKGNQTVDILFEQLRREQEFRENLFALHELKNKELFRQFAVLNNLVVTSQHQMENISQIWREPAEHTEIDDTNKLVQENDLAQNSVNQYSLPSRSCKFRSGSSDKAFIQADRSKESKNSDSGSKGHNDAEPRMTDKLDHRQSRSADFQKYAATGRKKKKLSAAFNSRMMNSIEASLKKVDLCQNGDDKQSVSLKKLDTYENCDDKQSLSLKKLDTYENCDDKQSLSLKKLDTYENCDDKQSQEHLSKSLAFSGAEIDQASISADGELVSSVEAPESCRAHRKGLKCPSLSSSPKTIARKFSDLKVKPLACTKLMHSDKSRVHYPDQLSASTTSQLTQKECSQHCPSGLVLSHKSAFHSRCKTDKLKPDMPRKLTIKHPRSLSKIFMTSDSTSLNHFVDKVANNKGPQMKGRKAACCSIVQRPLSDQRGKVKRKYNALKQLTDNMNNYIDSVAEAYPEKISLDVVNYFSSDELEDDVAYSSHLQESKNKLSQNYPDLQQRHETLPDAFPISSEMFSVITNKFVERLTDGHLEISDKRIAATGPKCESRASSRQVPALKFANGQSVESSGNLHTGRNVSTACGSIPENNLNNKSSSASLFSESVEPSDQGSSTSSQKSQNEKYPVQDDCKASRASKPKSEPFAQKRPWRSSSQAQSLGPISDTTNGRTGRRDGLGYACSASLQKKLSAMKMDQSQAKLGNKYKNPTHLAPKALLTKPVRGKIGYAAKAKQISWNADVMSQNFRQSTQQILPMKYCKEDAEMSLTTEKNEI